eukprot:COSAG01_NODE_13535_length_1570_cov_496.785180_3_plen_88_part_00
MDHFLIPSVTIKNGLAAEATQGSCKSRSLKWGILRDLFCNGRVIYDSSEGACTYVYAKTTCLSTLMVTYSLLLLAVTSSKMRSLQAK